MSNSQETTHRVRIIDEIDAVGRVPWCAGYGVQQRRERIIEPAVVKCDRLSERRVIIIAATNRKERAGPARCVRSA